ncbi:MAG: ThiF family adenylyltransferase [bacterium]|nr:ThiF family adenylyltransferase [bacterium]
MKHPQIKQALSPALRKDRTIVLGTMLFGTGVVLQDDEKNSLWSLMSLMDGTRTIPEIVQDFIKKHPEVDIKSVSPAIRNLIRRGFAEDKKAPLPLTITPDEAKRYSRSAEYFAWVDRKERESPFEYQAILKKSCVTVVGVGGIGSSTAASLTALGIGNLHLIDFDNVELSNLNRQILYTEKDIGRNKVSVVENALKSRNSSITVSSQNLRIDTYKDMESLFKNRHMIILCADNPYEKLREWANEAALKTEIPWIEGYSGGPQYAVHLYVPFKTPCYICVNHFFEREIQKTGFVDPDVINRVLEIQPVIAPSVNIAGHHIALQTAYYLLGIKPFIWGRQYRQNLLELDHILSGKPKFWKECPMCGRNGMYGKDNIKSEKKNAR